MNLLKIINPEGVGEGDIVGWEDRKAARAVVLDNDGLIGLLHVTNHGYYKLPGGGVEEGEDIKMALDRECEEELGVEIEVLGEIGSIIEYRARWKLHQTSYCFLAKTSGAKRAPNFTDEEKSSGFEIVWVEPKEALRLLDIKQTSDYEGKFIEQRDFYFLRQAMEEAEVSH